MTDNDFIGRCAWLVRHSVFEASGEVHPAHMLLSQCSVTVPAEAIVPQYRSPPVCKVRCGDADIVSTQQCVVAVNRHIKIVAHVMILRRLLARAYDLPYLSSEVLPPCRGVMVREDAVMQTQRQRRRSMAIRGPLSRCASCSLHCPTRRSAPDQGPLSSHFGWIQPTSIDHASHV